MPSYEWKGRDRNGNPQTGILIGDSKEAVIAALRRQQIVVTTVKEKGKEIALPKFGGGISPKNIAIFTRQFSVMIDAGLPLIQCLEILGTQQENKAFSAIIIQVRSDVESGSTLSEAMRKHPKAFDALFVNMIAAGEAGGILDQILERLSNYIEKAVKLKSQVKSALMYPVIVILVAIIVIAIIMIKVIPTFAAMFASAGNQLPLPTRITMGTSNFTVNYGIFIFILLLFGGWAVKKYHGTFHGRRVLDNLILKVPIVGGLLRKIAIARFCRTLSTLIGAGVPILDGIEITARTAGNAIVEDTLMGVTKEIEEGKTMSEPLSKSKVFPSMVVSMINVGESTGALDTMLSKIADFYEDEVDVAVATLMSMLEPVLIVFLGVVIGFIVISLYLPIFMLAQNA
jgi:type IV pilus assembly protein PilC